ncbi:hypothetical protein P7K49_031617 [Saguinus oedipus]|uniref:Uncharacterized protein n=1 Tax=Saguinus oedipus TaxID=9490 RepID=A0ABQ9TZX6_SAGOE|nr:hypothetical protein P7K49_031617 [Saguinus oedipus]
MAAKQNKELTQEKVFSSCGSTERTCQCAWKGERGGRGLQTEVQVKKASQKPIRAIIQECNE